MAKKIISEVPCQQLILVLDARSAGEEVFREIGTLSGGERARMALAIITLSKANPLVPDEPTNHLDVENIEVLEC